MFISGDLGMLYCDQATIRCLKLVIKVYRCVFFTGKTSDVDPETRKDKDLFAGSVS
jgi:hypothetical protein